MNSSKKLIYTANLRLPTEKAYGIQIAKMGEALARQGIKVKLVAPFRFSRIKTDFFQYYGVNKSFIFKKIFAPDFYLPGPLDKIAFGLKSFVSAAILDLYAFLSGADIYYFRDELPAYLMSFLVSPGKLIFEAHKYSPGRRFWFSRFRKKGIKIVTITNGLKEEFIKFGFIEKNILVVPDGVDLGEFGRAMDRSQAREQVGLPMDKEIVLYTGHLFGWKGADILAKAANHLPEVLFVFVGGTEADVFEFRKRNQNRGNVIILGYQPRKLIPLYLKAADVLVLPNSGQEPISRFYTSPLKLFEYMAAQRPIVASDLPSLREMLDQSNAVLVPPDNPSALAKGIRKVLSDSALTERLSRQARSDVQNYTWVKRAERILKFISDNKISKNWVILDRDGVVIKDKAYVFKIEDIEFMPGAIDGLKKISELGFKMIIVTNQAGIAKGYFTIKEMDYFNKELTRLLKKENIIIEKIYFCPHHPDFTGDCECRKPKTGLIKQASQEFGLIPSQCFFIGDKDSDTELGINCGGKTILITNNQYPIKIKANFKGKNLEEAAQIIANHYK